MVAGSREIPRGASWRALEEHTPLTVAEAGLELDPPPRRRWWLVGVAGLLGVIAVLVAATLIRSGDGRPSVLEVDLGACVLPVVTDVDAPVDIVACEPGAARVAVREHHPGLRSDLHPGDGALELFGQGVCQGRVDPDALVVAVPSPSSWAAGERTVACLQRL